MCDFIIIVTKFNQFYVDSVKTREFKWSNIVYILMDTFVRIQFTLPLQILFLIVIKNARHLSKKLFKNIEQNSKKTCPYFVF